MPERGRALSELADQKSLVLQVGHIERYSPIFEALRDIVKKPLFIEGNRISVYTGRSVDVNVVLDLMIHDIDLLIALVDSPVKSVDAVGAQPALGRYLLDPLLGRASQRPLRSRIRRLLRPRRRLR